MKGIIVFRHGAPDDVGDGISDRYGIPGADRLGQQIANVVRASSCIIYSSPVLRAMQTASRVALAIGLPVPVVSAVCLVYDDEERRKEILALVEEAWKEYDFIILSTHHPLTSTIRDMFFNGKDKGRWPSSRASEQQAFLYAEGLCLTEETMIRFPMVGGV